MPPYLLICASYLSAILHLQVLFARCFQVQVRMGQSFSTGTRIPASTILFALRKPPILYLDIMPQNGPAPGSAARWPYTSYRMACVKCTGLGG